MGDRNRASREAERGQAAVWVAVMLPLFLSVIGLAIDGGIVFSARRELQDIADGAARAGATQLDVARYRQDATVALDQNRAYDVAVAELANQAPGLHAAVDTDSQVVLVQVSRRVPTAFLRIVGLNSVAVTATALGRVQHGIDRGS